MEEQRFHPTLLYKEKRAYSLYSLCLETAKIKNQGISYRRFASLQGVNYPCLLVIRGYLAVPQTDNKFRMVYAFFIMIHIGHIIEQELRRQRRSISWFAKELYCDRTNVYKIFHKASIDTLLLYRISTILSHNFFQYYTEAFTKDYKMQRISPQHVAKTSTLNNHLSKQ